MAAAMTDDGDEENLGPLFRRFGSSGVDIPARSGHASRLVGSQLWVFAGTTENFYLGDVWVMELDKGKSDHGMWRQVLTKGTPPAARGYTRFAAVGTHLYVFGGVSGDFRNDIFVLDTETETWAELRPEGDLPPPRCGHSFNAVGNMLIVFGGVGETMAFLEDTWAFDTVLKCWIDLTSALLGSPPVKRRNHAAAVMGRRMYLVGGRSTNTFYCPGVHVLDLDAMSWTQLETTGDSPVPAAGSALVCAHWAVPVDEAEAAGGGALDDFCRKGTPSLLLHGGVRGSNARDHTYRLNLVTRVWTELAKPRTTEQRQPRPLVHVVDDGADAAPGANQTLETEAMTDGSGGGGSPLPSSQEPLQRGLHTCVLTPDWRLVVFGGDAGRNDLADTWGADVSEWLPRVSSSAV